MSFLDEVVAKLVADGLAADTGTGINIFYGKATIPAGNGPFMFVTESGGAGPERTQNAVTTVAYQRPSLQIVVIAGTWSVARAKVKALYNALTVVRNTVLSGVFYREINADQEPFDFPMDAAGRPRIGFNISAIKRPS